VYTLTNAAYRKFVGDARLLLGLDVRSALPEVAGQGFFELLDQVYQTGESYVGRGRPVELMIAGEVTRAVIDFIYTPLFDRNDRVRGIFCLGHDVTEHYALLDTMRHIEKSLRDDAANKDRFLATLAHELRNPLAPIGIAAQVISGDTFTPETLKKSTAIIQRQSAQMARLLDDLLDVARISTAKFELKRQPITLEALVATAIETARPNIDARQHHLHVTLTHADRSLNIDSVRMAQVIANLLNNAAKYTDPAGRISLEARVEGDDLICVVSDSGIGIDPAAQARIFDMFGQETSAHERADGGLGIGLALVKGIVELHGGSVQVASEGSGRGSQFSVRLPGVASPAVGSIRARSDVRAASVSIVIADDNVDIAESLRILLETQEHRVYTAKSGLEALQLTELHAPDVVMLDIGMPGLSGYEVASTIRQAPWGQRLVLVAATGWGQESDRQTALAAGFDYHLTKPIDLDQLNRILALRDRPTGSS